MFLTITRWIGSVCCRKKHWIWIGVAALAFTVVFLNSLVILALMLLSCGSPSQLSPQAGLVLLSIMELSCLKCLTHDLGVARAAKNLWLVLLTAEGKPGGGVVSEEDLDENAAAPGAGPGGEGKPVSAAGVSRRSLARVSRPSLATRSSQGGSRHSLAPVSQRSLPAIAPDPPVPVPDLPVRCLRASATNHTLTLCAQWS